MDLTELRARASKAIEESKSLSELEDIRVRFVGRKGELTMFLRSLKDLPIEEKKKFGPEANNLRTELEEALTWKEKELQQGVGEASLVDTTMPGRKVQVGHLHPLTIVCTEIKKIFTDLNFAVVEGPEVETEHYNFDALNIPSGHPARDMWDTFWIKDLANRKSQIANRNDGDMQYALRDKLLLRTHTSPVQIRYMETHEPPFQIIVPGRVFRFEAIDASHEINFYQVEGLMVGPDVTLANFKYIITEFFKKLFNGKIELRFRPSYFPFVEPGLEVDIQLKGKWLEVMGAGMVHPKVFDAVKYNPKFVLVFAFVLCLERIAMIKYGIPDIRMFYENDLRFLKQF